MKTVIGELVVMPILAMLVGCSLLRTPSKYTPDVLPRYLPDTTDTTYREHQYSPSDTSLSQSLQTEPRDASARYRWGYLTVHSTPSGAEIYLDDTLVANTPLDSLNRSPKKYRLQITKDGYEPHEGVVRIEAFRETKLDVSLTEQ